MTLRSFTLGLGLLMLLAGVIAAAFGQLFAFHLLFGGLILTAGVLFESWRYKRTLTTPPATGAIATGERFIDPTGGDTIEVYCDPRTGERSYVTIKRRAD